MAAATPRAGESLAEVNPNLADEWDIDSNKPLSPESVRPNSGFKANWICRECGRRWKQIVSLRALRGYGCQVCAAKKRARKLATAEASKSFIDKFPELAIELVDTGISDRKITEIKPNSNVYAVWRCQRGHTYRMMYASRAQGKGCPRCYLYGKSAIQIRLACELISCGVPAEIDHPPIKSTRRKRPVKPDIAIPDWGLILEFDGSHYHSGESNLARDLSQTDALIEAGWRVIRIREKPLTPTTENDILVEKDLDVKSLTLEVIRGLESACFAIPLAEKYRVDVTTWAEDKARSLLARKLSINLASEFPDISAEWHPTHNGGLLPEHVHPYSNSKYWFQCSTCGYAWEALLTNRTGKQRSGCPECYRTRRKQSRPKPRPGKSLAETYPSIASTWHSSLNGKITPLDVTAGSNSVQWWVCPRCGRDWQSSVTNRVKNKGCRSCRRWKSGNEAHPTPNSSSESGDLNQASSA